MGDCDNIDHMYHWAYRTGGAAKEVDSMKACVINAAVMLIFV
jgi:hypothetical protein